MGDDPMTVGMALCAQFPCGQLHIVLPNDSVQAMTQLEILAYHERSGNNIWQIRNVGSYRMLYA